jgi:uroporphyrinogen-III decarboxylase
VSEVDELLEMYQPSPGAVEAGRRRQEIVWQGKEADNLPIILRAPPRPERQKYPTYNLEECYYDADKMLASQLWGMIELADAQSDAVPSLRANTGVGTLATVFGCRNTVFPDKMPWVTTHLTIDEALDAPVDDVARRGEMPRVLRYMEYFCERLDGRGLVYCADTQGPLDLAHIVLGNAFFLLLHDAATKMHEMLDKCTRVIIEATRAMKEAVGEPIERGAHSGTMWMGAGGVRVCEDTTTLLSPACVREFAVPYTRRLCAAFGGGWVHFCGDGQHVLDAFLDVPEVKGFNFGNPERFDEQTVLPALQERGKFYFGTWPMRSGEELETYFKRLLGALRGRRSGLILDAPVRPGDGTTAQCIEIWRRLQER